MRGFAEVAEGRSGSSSGIIKKKEPLERREGVGLSSAS